MPVPIAQTGSYAIKIFDVFLILSKPTLICFDKTDCVFFFLFSDKVSPIQKITFNFASNALLIFKLINLLSSPFFLFSEYSENRKKGEDNRLINLKIKSALEAKLKVIFCIGETLSEKRKKKTQSVLSKQIKVGLDNIKNTSNIFIAYEPVWAIGTGIVPKSNDLLKTVKFIKSKFKDKSPKVLYGGSVNPQNVKNLKEIKNIDGFLIGGASQNAKKFIDIVKKTYS